MLRKSLLGGLLGAAVVFGVLANTAVASSGSSHEVSAPLPASGGPVDLVIPGIGTVTVTVDPATGAITTVTLAPEAGVVAGTPVTTDDGANIPVTLADGTAKTVKIEVEHHDGVATVEAEVRRAGGEGDCDRDDDDDHDEVHAASAEREGSHDDHDDDNRFVGVALRAGGRK